MVRASALRMSELTPAERQEILRRLKHGPVMDREALAEYAKKVKMEVLKKREGVKN